MGAENGCLKIATETKQEAEFFGAKILLVRNWYMDFLGGGWAFICKALAMCQSNPSSGRLRSGGRVGRVWRE
jgi:hypothetical protein